MRVETDCRYGTVAGSVLHNGKNSWLGSRESTGQRMVLELTVTEVSPRGAYINMNRLSVRILDIIPQFVYQKHMWSYDTSLSNFLSYAQAMYSTASLDFRESLIGLKKLYIFLSPSPVGAD